MNTLKWCSDSGRSETHIPLVSAVWFCRFFCVWCFSLLMFSFAKSLTLHLSSAEGLFEVQQEQDGVDVSQGCVGV